MRGFTKLVGGAVWGLFAALFTLSPAAAQEDEAQGAGLSQPVPSSTESHPPLIPTRHFASQSVLKGAKFSRSGQLMAFIVNRSGQSTVVAASPVTGETKQEVFLPEGFSAEFFRWVDHDRLLVTARGIHKTPRYYYSVRRVFLVALSSNSARSLIADPFVSSYARILRTSADGSFAIIAHPHEKDADFPTVYKYDLNTLGTGKVIQPWVNGIDSWMVDKAGVVRVGLVHRRDKFQMWYRRAAGDPLALIKDQDYEERGSFTAALRIDKNSDEGYVLAKAPGAQRAGLHRYDYSTGQIVDTLYENPDWDVDEVVFDDTKPLRVGFTAESDQSVWLDQESRNLYRQLATAIGNKSTRLQEVSRSKDGQRLLVWAGNAADPGVLYFFDKATKQMGELAQYRPLLDFTQLVSPQPVKYTARDGTEIPAFLTLPRGREAKGLPLIIHPHGGPFGARDKLRYDDEVQLLANRGYAVIQPNFRGSGGYGEAHYDLGIGQVGRKMQDDLDDAMDWAVAEGIADPSRVCVVGGSYGGYAAMWAVLRNPERYRCAASWAGVTDWDEILKYDKRFLTRSARKRHKNRLKGENGFNLDDVSPKHAASTLSRPLLLAQGTRDRIVPVKQHEIMMKAAEGAPVPPTELLIYSATHSFGQARLEQQWYDALDAFLAKHNPADQVDEDGNLRKAKDPAMEARFIDIGLDKPEEAQ